MLLAQKVAERLVGRWNRYDQYRYWETIELAQRTIDQVGATYDLWHQFARAQNFLGEKRASLTYYQQALALCQAAKDEEYEASILNNLGLVYDDLREKPEALRYYHLALPLRRQVGDKGGEATTLNNLGGIYFGQGDLPAASVHFTQALALRLQVGDRFGEVVTRWWLATLYEQQNALPAAVTELETALALATAVQSPHVGAI